MQELRLARHLAGAVEEDEELDGEVLAVEEDGGGRRPYTLTTSLAGAEPV
jgi:hypothetical protein